MSAQGESNGSGGGSRDRAAAVGGAELDVSAILDGKNILLIGCTGFVGKVTLSMLLRRYPNVGRVYLLVRPGAGNSAEDRFFTKVAASPAFDPVRELWGDGYDSFMHEKVAPIPGDIGRPLCNFSGEQLVELSRAGGLAAIVNSAGLVTFNPSLESALRINTIGAKNVLELARETGAALVHVSTCFVAGQRDGEVWEDERVVGYFPRHGELRDDDFDAEAEIADCQRLIEEVRARANDRAHISQFRERGARALEAQRRDPDDEGALRLAVARERKMWIHERLTQLGMERATHWGWTNTYTYSKSLGEQVVLGDPEVRATVVRPAVVESAVRYPFPGWNEGFNTTAPLVYLCLKGHRQVVTGTKSPLDLIPVDYIATGLIAATAAVIAGEAEPVYQLGSSDSNPVTAARLTELTGLAVRRYYRDKADAGENPLENRIRARLEAFPVSSERFNRLSAPSIKRAADRLSRALDDHLPSWGAPRLSALAERAKEELSRISEFSGQVTELVDLFKPFTHDWNIVFRCDNIRRLCRRLSPQDQQWLIWDPETIDWRAYWLGTHFPGLQEWVFPILDDEFRRKPRSVYTYKDLVELFDSATKLHRHRVAMRLTPSDPDAASVVYTYERVQDMAAQAAGCLRERGVQVDDRVVLISENRPEWGISYFGILKAGATAVPVDAQLSLGEVARLAGWSGARVIIASDRALERMVEEEELQGEPAAAVSEALAGLGADVELLRFEDVLAEPSVSSGAMVPRRRADSVASLIYTSGTTGDPKGVMLTHKNLTALASRLSSVIPVYRHDSLLSVLPLHHTFEFSAGFLLPFIHGSQITYLDDITPELLGDTLREGSITAMIGVPALWQLLHRKIFKQVSDAGPIVQRAFETVVDLNRRLRERVPYGWHLGRVLFFPVHRRLGGRMRLLVSGGSALSPDVMKSFQGLGFRLYEGYGLTEAAPVLAVQRPGEQPVVGSVGRALPGIDIRIFEPDEHGVGEVIAKGPNVMKGYYHNERATAEVLREGWLHTGDLGRLDDDGNLYIVGRKKDMILGASGENVYPDELEEIYRDCPYVDEISVVGLPTRGGGETVAALVVPDYDQDGLDREVVRARLRDHIKQVSARLPLHKRIKVFHLWDHELPKTSTRKVKRREVVAEVERLERAAKGAERAQKSAAAATAVEAAGRGWVVDVVAQVTQKPKNELNADARLEDLGFDSLMFTELGVALEAAGVALPDAGALAGLATVADVEAYVSRHGLKPKSLSRPVEGGDTDEIHVPPPAVAVGRRVLRLGQRMLYERLLDAGVCGRAYVPPFGGYIVAANHSSHLDMGLVKHALGEQGPNLVALAAKDYFFDDPVRRAYFENFTNLVPMERRGSLRESLQVASDVLREGYILLIFPEGTRSESGLMSDFKASLGYLALTNRCGILPMYLGGTHDAMPKGAFVPKQRDVSAHIGPFQAYERLAEMAIGLSRSDSYRRVSNHIERMVRRLAPPELAWTLGEAGRQTAVDREQEAAAATAGANGDSGRPGKDHGGAAIATGSENPPEDEKSASAPASHGRGEVVS